MATSDSRDIRTYRLVRMSYSYTILVEVLKLVSDGIMPWDEACETAPCSTACLLAFTEATVREIGPLVRLDASDRRRAASSALAWSFFSKDAVVRLARRKGAEAVDRVPSSPGSM